MKEKLSLMIKFLDIHREVYNRTKKWITPDAVMFIESYFEQHPEVKRTHRLERKLEREYYRSLRKKRKDEKL